MNMGRRGLLKLMGVAPAVAAAAPALATQAAGFTVPGLAAGASHNAMLDNPGPDGGRVFTTLVSFMKDREGRWREHSKSGSSVDPDIASMRLPLVTKVRMQSERNFEKIKLRESNWFNEMIAQHGQVRVW